MKWDKVTWNADNRVVMYSKTLLSWRGRRVDLHKIVGEDVEGCFHSHPANALRVILWNSYYEEDHDKVKPIKRWGRGMIGYVPAQLTHRIHAVGEPCYTLWIRGRNRFKLRLIGYGKEERVPSSAGDQEGTP